MYSREVAQQPVGMAGQHFVWRSGRDRIGTWRNGTITAFTSMGKCNQTIGLGIASTIEIGLVESTKLIRIIAPLNNSE